MADIGAVFFDLDGTLIDDDAASLLAAQRTCNDLAAHLGTIDPMQVANTRLLVGKTFWLHRAEPAGVLAGGSDAARRRTLWSQALSDSGIVDSDRLADEFGAAYSRHKASIVVTYRDATAVLEALRAEGYRIAVITNGPRDLQQNKLRLAGLDHLVDVFVPSSDHHAGKPERVVFDAAIDAIGADRAATWHIGDNLATDVTGALNAGLKAAWLNRNGEVAPPKFPPPDATISDLRELLPLLGIETSVDA